jgi:hypothetical protein
MSEQTTSFEHAVPFLAPLGHYTTGVVGRGGHTDHHFKVNHVLSEAHGLFLLVSLVSSEAGVTDTRPRIRITRADVRGETKPVTCLRKLRGRLF